MPSTPRNTNPIKRTNKAQLSIFKSGVVYLTKGQTCVPLFRLTGHNRKARKNDRKEMLRDHNRNAPKRSKRILHFELLATLVTSMQTLVSGDNSLEYTAFLLIVNSSLPVIDNIYSEALSTTLATCMNISVDDVIVYGSQTQNRRLLELFIFLAEVHVSVPLDQIPDNLYESDGGAGYLQDLQKLVSRFVYSGNATALFRSELSQAGAEYDESIGISAFHASSMTVGSPPSESTNNDSPDLQNRGSIFLIVISIISFLLLACLSMVLYSCGTYLIGLYRWKNLTKTMNEGNIAKEKEAGQQQRVVDLSVIISDTVLESIFEDGSSSPVHQSCVSSPKRSSLPSINSPCTPKLRDGIASIGMMMDEGRIDRSIWTMDEERSISPVRSLSPIRTYHSPPPIHLDLTPRSYTSFSHTPVNSPFPPSRGHSSAHKSFKNTPLV